MAIFYGKRPTILGESGKIEISDSIDNGIVERVIFSEKYVDPVVVTFLSTTNDSYSVESRVKNVTQTSCVIFFERPDNSVHTSETVHYLVMEKGVHQLQDGAYVEAGSVSSDAVYYARSTDTLASVSFSHSFASAPVVLHDINSYNNEAFMSTITRSVTSNGFQIQQMALETNSPSTTEELVWIAFQPGTYDFYEAVILGDVYTHSPRAINFQKTYSVAPDVIVKGVDVDGSDGYYVRGVASSNALSVSVYTEEDTITDSDTAHTTEQLVYFASKSGMKFYEQYILNERYNQ